MSKLAIPDLVEEMQAIQRWAWAFKRATAGVARGTSPCMACQADARWTADPRCWEIECAHCGWNAAGKVPREALN
ncbi:MAG: hypothetical protein JWQ94_560 [Tardiphaga sp.]|nr:hypothetical protein [Tardiphaga sp.]